MITKQPLSVIDSFYNYSHTMIQFGLEVTNPDFIQTLIERFKKCIIGLHLSTDSTHMYRHSMPEPVFRIPNHIDSLAKACDYVYHNHTLPYSRSLASIGYNDKYLVLNNGHMVSDGGYYTLGIKELLNPSGNEINHNFPLSMEKVFAKELENTTVTPPHIYMDKNITRITPVSKPDPKSHYTSQITFEFPVSYLCCYNKKTGKCDGLTERFWEAGILSAAAMNNNIDVAGVMTSLNMRNYLKPNLFNWAACNFYSSMTVSADASRVKTVGDLGKLLRKDLNEKIKNNYHFAFIKSLGGSNLPKDRIPGIGLEMSHIGKFEIKKPVVNLMIRSSVEEKFSDPFFTMSYYSVVGESRNDLKANMKYNGTFLGTRDAKTFVNGIKFYLTNIPKDASLNEAIGEISKFQKTL